MRFLITGGAGFIGAALANRLVKEGHHVRVIDNLSAGDPSRLVPEVSFTRGDIMDVPKLWRILQKVDCVYHLAARVSVPESILYPREYNTTNVGGTVAVMEAMRDAGVKKVVFTSSGSVYGEQKNQPVRESFAPAPASPYAVSKLAAEHYINTTGSLWDIETVSLRIFNAYGPWQDAPVAHPPAIPQFLKQAAGHGSLVIFGDGEQTRDFIYIDDVIDALVAASTAGGINRHIINIGSGQEISINLLVKEVEEAVGAPVSVLHVKEQDGGVPRLVADLTLAAEKLGFAPKVSLQDGLRLLLEKDERFGSNLPESGTERP